MKEGTDYDPGKYLECMEEIKLRIEVVDGFLSRELNARYVQSTAECVALQLRKVLELIALASMAANRSEYAKQRKRFYSDWNGKRILKTLERVNPGFYPVPSEQEVRGDGVKALHPIASGFLTKDDYALLFDECSALLHARNPFAPGSMIDADQFLLDASSWSQKIKRLLNHHTVRLVDRDYLLAVVMRSRESEGRVTAGTLQRIDNVIVQ